MLKNLRLPHFAISVPLLALALYHAVEWYLSNGGPDVMVHGMPILATVLGIVGTLFVKNVTKAAAAFLPFALLVLLASQAACTKQQGQLAEQDAVNVTACLANQLASDNLQAPVSDLAAQALVSCFPQIAQSGADALKAALQNLFGAHRAGLRLGTQGAIDMRYDERAESYVPVWVTAQEVVRAVSSP